MVTAEPSQVETLLAPLRTKVPNAELVPTKLPLVPELELFLLSESYPQQLLSAEQVENLMDDPPYWAFCWASGQVLARWLLDKQDWIAGKRVIDFGCGSGVVAIAAMLAGASNAIAVDSDPNALAICKANAKRNRVSVETQLGLDKIKTLKDDILLIADVFYDADNIPLLQTFQQRFNHVIVADSRIKSGDLSSLTPIAQMQSHTVPDLAEAKDFNLVRLYQS